MKKYTPELPRWILLTRYPTSEIAGMRTWGDIRGTDEQTRIDLYPEGGTQVWSAYPVVGDKGWSSRLYPDLWTALRAANRWVQEMSQYGFDADGITPQLRDLDTPDYVENPSAGNDNDISYGAD